MVTVRKDRAGDRGVRCVLWEVRGDLDLLESLLCLAEALLEPLLSSFNGVKSVFLSFLAGEPLPKKDLSRRPEAFLPVEVFLTPRLGMRSPPPSSSLAAVREANRWARLVSGMDAPFGTAAGRGECFAQRVCVCVTSHCRNIRNGGPLDKTVHLVPLPSNAG